MTPSFGDIHEFVAVVELEDIFPHEERSRRIVWDEDPSERSLPESSNSLAMMRGDKTFHFRFRTLLTDKNAEYVADFESVYSIPELSEVTDDILKEFAERVAFMAVYPYLRASIYGSAARLGQPIPVLGIVRQGEFEQGEAMSEAQVKEAFSDNRTER